MNWIRQREAFRQANWANENLKQTTSRAPWSLRVLGESGIGYLDYSSADESELLKVSRLFPEARVYSFEIIRNGVSHRGTSERAYQGLIEFSYYKNGSLFVKKVVAPLG